MTLALSNKFLQFEVDIRKATWQLAGGHNHLASVRGVRSSITYRSGRRRFLDLQQWHSPEISDPVIVDSPQGPLRQIQLTTGKKEKDLRYTFIFALCEYQPLFLWKLSIENIGTQPVQIDQIELLRSIPPSGTVTLTSPSQLSGNIPAWAFFSNGWQSWSFSGVYTPKDRYRASRLGPIHLPFRINAGTPYPKVPGVFASDMFGVLGDRDTRAAVLVGFLSQWQHFGSLEADIRRNNPALRMWANGDSARLDPGARMVTDWACLTFLEIDDPDPLGVYLDAVAQQHNLSIYPNQLRKDSQHSNASMERAKQAIPTGWCSWYQYFKKVTAEDIQRNLEAVLELQPDLPLDFIQIDDGFETHYGDWFTFRSGFSNGLSHLAEEIHTAGMRPGLWLSPFMVHPKSQLARDHPDWLLRGRFGRPVNAGFLLNTFITGLDLTHPDASKYAAETVNTAVHKWRYSYIKLDFLYAAALPGKYCDPTQTRAQVLRRGLEALRSAAGDATFLLGCGCPLGSTIGLVDAMRIGADVDPSWSPNFNGIQIFFKNEPDLPSIRNAIHNSLTRAPLHLRWWINDPDCLLLGPDTALTLDEIQSLASVIALSGGPLFLSDDLPSLPPERLRIAKMLLPLIGHAPRVLDWLDKPTPRRLRLDLRNNTGIWHLIACFNWEERPVDLLFNLHEFDLDPSTNYYASEFWGERLSLIEGGCTSFEQVPSHGVILLAIRPQDPVSFQYLGSNMHISQGLEVVNWVTTANTLSFRLERPGQAQGHLTVGLPGSPHQAALDGQSITWTEAFPSCYRFAVDFYQTGALHIRL
jgi:alpha-galactosidase